MQSPNNAKRKPEYLRVFFFSFKLFFVDVSALSGWSGSIDYVICLDCRAIEPLVPSITLQLFHQISRSPRQLAWKSGCDSQEIYATWED